MLQPNLTLPVFMTKKTKWLWGLIALSLCTSFYFLSNHYHFFTPMIIPQTIIDKNVSFYPWTIWIYHTEYILLLSAYAFMPKTENAMKYLYSLALLQIFSAIIFFLFPTTLPRELYDIPEETHHWTKSFFESFRKIDTPANCLPSMHVASCYLAAFAFRGLNKKKYLYYMIWATLIAISTLTTKQHYFLDILAGYILAEIFHWFFYKFTQYKSEQK